ncbi:7-keto-8-aminopelargonate synthetase [Myriangium duriaei CBS 260.36]|uniref:7-keto-8-aminopelargonate synthetase n=1 Tax=Myriangium duriaei CBS 260.36 TaxID=1168546 RepID=A0A9P4JA88_9PEZI|nr:7-keto-8-aminopelargonate synthetase [Myriangium duriaei CBS 260.36]
MSQDEPSALDSAINASLSRRRRSSTLRRLTLSPHDSIDFSSNDFLSLSTSDELRQRYLSELSSRSDFPLGSGGSRLLDGNTTYAESLENQIAVFHNAPAALLANSGFDANVAIFSTLPQPGDVIIYDDLIHASVHDGMRASRLPSTHRFSFRHNDVQSFTSVLQYIITHFPSLSNGKSSLFLALEAIYSMDGDIPPLQSLISTLDALSSPSLRRNTHIVIDEAHATGVLGPKGAGLVSSLNLQSRVTIRLHTFGKALAANGAAILCPPQVKQYLINYARALIYTTFLSFPALALVRSAYSLMAEGRTQPLADRLWANLTLLWTELVALQTRFPPAAVDDGKALLSVSLEPPRSAIFSVETSRPRELAGYCQAQGYLVRPIMPPTVPAGSERVRVCLHAGNSEAEIKGLVATMERWCEGVVRARRGLGARGAAVSVEAERAKL